MPDDEHDRQPAAARSATPDIRAFDLVLTMTPREYREAHGLADALREERQSRAEDRTKFEESRRQAKARGGTVYR